MESNNLLYQIREVVQEEIQRASPAASPAPSRPSNNLISRTRSLINNTTSSDIEDFNRNVSYPPQRRSRIGHVDRMPSGKKKKVETKTFEIQILKAYEFDIDGETDDKIPDYGLEDSHVLMKQVMVDLKTNMKE